MKEWIVSVHSPSHNYVKRAQIKINVLHVLCMYCYLLYVIVAYCSRFFYIVVSFFHYEPLCFCCRVSFFSLQAIYVHLSTLLSEYNGENTKLYIYNTITMTYNNTTL